MHPHRSACRLDVAAAHVVQVPAGRSDLGRRSVLARNVGVHRIAATELRFTGVVCIAAFRAVEGGHQSRVSRLACRLLPPGPGQIERLLGRGR